MPGFGEGDVRLAMHRRLLNVLAGFVRAGFVLCVVIGLIIPPLFLVFAGRGTTLETCLWITWFVASLGYSALNRLEDHKARKYEKFRFSPEGQRRRAQEVQQSIAAIIAGTQARPKLSRDDIRRLVEGFPAGAVMTMARYVAKNIAKEELKGRGVKMSEIEASDINEIANALLETDASIIETAKANFKKLNPGKRYA